MLPISDINYRARFPYVNFALIAANILVYLYEVTLSGNFNLARNTRQFAGLLYSWSVIPVEYTQGVDLGTTTPNPVYITLLTAMFLHGSLIHIGGNMLFLWVFGDNVESNMGHLKYLLFYFICGIIAGGAHIAMNMDSRAPSLGASGAIAGVLAAYLVLYPKARVRTLVFIPPFITIIGVYAIILIGIWFLMQLWDGLVQFGAQTAQTGGVAFWAHIGGFIAGLVLVFLFRGPTSPPSYQRRYARRPPRMD